jgi:predicted phage-related endonuclease
MLWGRRLEPLVAGRYAQVTGRKLAPGMPMFQNPERPHLLANTDRTILGRNGQKDHGVYEGKTVDASRAREWDGQIPLFVRAQLQHYFYVCQLTWGSAAALIGGNRFVWFDEERDDRFLAEYLACADAFWARVESGEPPALVGAADERRALDLLYGRPVRAKSVRLDGPAAALAAEWDDARARFVRARAELSRCETLLLGEIGDAEVAHLADGSGFRVEVERAAGGESAAAARRVLVREPKCDG